MDHMLFEVIFWGWQSCFSQLESRIPEDVTPGEAVGWGHFHWQTWTLGGGQICHYNRECTAEPILGVLGHHSDHDYALYFCMAVRNLRWSASVIHEIRDHGSYLWLSGLSVFAIHGKCSLSPGLGRSSRLSLRNNLFGELEGRQKETHVPGLRDGEERTLNALSDYYLLLKVS